jgi:hypothetical protein
LAEEKNCSVLDQKLAHVRCSGLSDGGRCVCGLRRILQDALDLDQPLFVGAGDDCRDALRPRRRTDNVAVVGVLKASVADIKEGSYIGSGAMPQPDGTQKAVEVHVFAESQRGQGDGHRDGWDGTAYGSGIGTMTNGAVGQAVTSVDGPVITVKYQGGEKKVVVGPNTPIVRYEVGEKSELKPGATIAVAAATKKPDGTFSAARINVGRNGVVPN